MSALAKLSETAVSLTDSSDMLYLNLHAIGRKFVQIFIKMRVSLGLCWYSSSCLIPLTPRGLDVTLSEWVGGFKSPKMFPTNISNAGFWLPKIKSTPKCRVLHAKFQKFPGTYNPEPHGRMGDLLPHLPSIRPSALCSQLPDTILWLSTELRKPLRRPIRSFLE